MKNIKIYFLVFLAFFLASCKNTENTENINQSTQNQENQNNSEKNFKQILQENDKIFVDSSEFNSCIAQNVDFCINSTARTIASKEWNIEVCNKLKTTESQDACKLGSILDKTWTSQDCDKISDDYLKLICKSNLIKINIWQNSKIEDCQEIEKIPNWSQEDRINEKDACINAIIFDNPDSKIEDCEHLTLEENKNHCKDIINFNSQNKNN